MRIISNELTCQNEDVNNYLQLQITCLAVITKDKWLAEKCTQCYKKKNSDESAKYYLHFRNSVEWQTLR